MHGNKVNSEIKGKSLAEAVKKLREASPAQKIQAAQATAGTLKGGKGDHKPDAQGQAVGARALRVASAVKGSHKRRLQVSGGIRPTSTAGRDAIVASNSRGSSSGMGPIVIGRFAPPPVKAGTGKLTTKDGQLFGVYTKSYGTKRLTEKDLGMPVTLSGYRSNSEMRAHEYHDKRGRVLQTVGRQFLGVVGTSAAGALAGQHIGAGAYVMMPDALGGVLSLQSKEYEQHVVKKMRVLYVPEEPTIIPGSIGMFFRNDVGTPTQVSGMEMLAIATSHTSYVSDSIWSKMSMDVDPEDAMKRYFDEETGDFRLECQGLVEVIATSPLAVNLPCGNLYLEYDVEFFAPELDTEVENVITGELGVAFDVSDAAFPNLPILFDWLTIVLPVGAGVFCEWNNGGPLDSVSYCLQGNILELSGAGLQYVTLENPTPRTLKAGDILWFRLFQTDPGTLDFTDGTIRMIVYESFAAANGNINVNDDVPGGASPGQLLWSGTNTGVPGTFTLECRAIPLTTV